AEPEGTRLYLMAPRSVEPGQTYDALWDELRRNGFGRVRVDGVTHALDDPPDLDRRRKHEVDVVVDRVVVRASERSRIAEGVETALSQGRGVMRVAKADAQLDEQRWLVVTHSQHLACQQCGRSFQPFSPHNFSFNSSLGWCPQCEGLGVQVGTDP